MNNAVRPTHTFARNIRIRASIALVNSGNGSMKKLYLLEKLYEVHKSFVGFR